MEMPVRLAKWTRLLKDSMPMSSIDDGSKDEDGGERQALGRSSALRAREGRASAVNWRPLEV